MNAELPAKVDPLVTLEPFSCHWELLPGLAVRLFRELGVDFDLAAATYTVDHPPDVDEPGNHVSQQVHRLWIGEQRVEVRTRDWQSGEYTAAAGGMGVSWGLERSGEIAGLPGGGAVLLGTSEAGPLRTLSWTGAEHREAWNRAVSDYEAYLPRVVEWSKDLGAEGRAQLSLAIGWDVVGLYIYPPWQAQGSAEALQLPTVTRAELASGKLRDDIRRVFDDRVAADAIEAAIRLDASCFRHRR